MLKKKKKVIQKNLIVFIDHLQFHQHLTFTLNFTGFLDTS